MSLSALIDKLSTLVSKAYIFSAFIPVLVFAFLNAALLWFHSRLFHRWAALELDKPSAFDLACLALGLAVAAYLLFSVNTFLREVLEGKYLPPTLRSFFLARQQQQLNDLSTSYTKARDDRYDIADSIPKWREDLSLAAFAGIQSGRANTYTKDKTAAKDIRKLAAKFAAAQPIGFAELKQMSTDLQVELKASNENAPSADDDPALGRSQLRADRIFLTDLFDHVKSVLLEEENRLLTERQFRFGFTPEPTALGNISASVYAWAMIRYSMNLATFWSRLQPGLQAESGFYTVLQDAKFQVDFLIACCWLTTLTWLPWTFALASIATPLVVWLGVTLISPLLAYFFYRMAVTSYAAFADVMRTSVDLYRFSVLRAMHIPVPKSIREERQTWRTLQKLTVFGQEDIELSYAADPPKAPVA